MDNPGLKMNEQNEARREQIPDDEEKIFYEDDSPDTTPPSRIIAYNELRSCADLVNMHGRGHLRTDPDFQRDFVWGNSMQTRFIDSLIKCLPIPSMCIAYDRRANERIAIDGRQRLSTLIRFFNPAESSWRLARLEDIDQHISGKTLKQIREEKSDYIDRVYEHTLPITILDCELSSEVHMDYIFTIFHRLNTGGAKLTNQEIRNCIYSGSLNLLLKKLDLTHEWRRLNRMQPDNNHRFMKQELILRFFAFFYHEKNYRGGMAKFLNDFMRTHQHEEAELLQKFEFLFHRVVAIFSRIFENQDSVDYIPANVMYPIMVAIGKNVDGLEKLSSSELEKRYQNLLHNEAFADQASLSSVSIVHGRLESASTIFGS